MESKTIYTEEFPVKINSSKPGAFFFAGRMFDFFLLLALIYIEFNAVVIVVLFLFLSLFKLLDLRIGAIEKTVETCRYILNENTILSLQNEEFKNKLIRNDTPDPEKKLIKKNDKNRLIFFYVLFFISLPVYVYIDLAAPEKAYLIIVFNVPLLYLGLAIYDIRKVQNYFKYIVQKFSATALNNAEYRKVPKIDLIYLWNKQKQLLTTISIIIVLIIVFTLIQFFIDTGFNQIFFIIPFFSSIPLFFINYKLRDVVTVTLELLRDYDNTVKEQLGVIYRPDLREKDRSYRDDFKKSAQKEIWQELNKDVKSFFDIKELFK